MVPMTTLPEREGNIAAAVTVIAWAAAFPAIRAGLEGFSPWALGAARLTIASLALGAAALVLLPARPPRHLWVRLVLAGLVGQRSRRRKEHNPAPTALPGRHERR